MTSTLMESPEIREARRQTTATSTAASRLKHHLAKMTDGLLHQAIRLVDSWQRVAEIVDSAAKSDAIDDYMGLGDMLWPYVVASREALEIVDELRLGAKDLECEMPNGVDFEISVYEMGKVVRFFESWPKTRSDIAEKIREEFAKAQYRDFEEFLNEIQAGHHTVG